ncbi:ATP-binding protein [Acaryochloris sp. 'Moss Beach']|uniref:ATP-binding protein n=1 Tax=Acaryochloris sp. 'Moss Beach' TaxID=2740837 RepID=UPI0037BE353D
MILSDPHLIESQPFDLYTLKALKRLNIGSYLVVPIIDGTHLWGLLMATQDVAPYDWDLSATQIMAQVGTQLGVAVQQAELLAHSQKQASVLKATKEEAERANRSKSDFLSHMSHELRTPLNAILGYAQLMQHSQHLGAQETKYVNTINRSGNHLLALINDVLEMAKIEAGQLHLSLVSFDLYNLLTELEELFSLKASSKQLQLYFHGQALVPRYIKTDQGKLRQVLINLLGNAIKFTQKGQIDLYVSVDGQTLTFAISDTGPGINAEGLDKLFNAFEQGDIGLESREGTGLGLSISKKFVRLMGGDLTVNSQKGQGSTFVFHIPLVIANEVVQDIDESVVQSLRLDPNQPDFRILVADDEQTNRTPLSEFLCLMGFSVREAKNGREALLIWREWQPHLIWMDMQMPELDGYQATQKIKATSQGNNTIVIALTASVFEEDKQKVLDAGCDDILRKPFRQNEVLQKMAAHLGVKYLSVESPQVRDPVDKDQRHHPENLDPENFKVMPPDWIIKINQRANQGNDLLLLQLIEQISSEHEAMAIRLTNLVENYQFDKIIQLTEALIEK